MQNLTLNQTVELLLRIARQHKQVRTANHVKAEDFVVYNYKDVEYPAVWFTLNNRTFGTRERTYQFIVTIADMHTVDEMDELEVQSDCELIADDILAAMAWDNQPWTLQRQGTIEYFREGQEDMLAGVTFSVDLKMPLYYDNCRVPTDYVLPGGDFIIDAKRYMSIADFIVSSGAPMEDGDTTFTSNALVAIPFVFIDGVLVTYSVATDRRYVSFNSTTKTITINNGTVLNGENVRIIL